MASKISLYHQAKSTADHISSAVAYCLGRDSPSNDKHSFRASFTKIVNASFSPMEFQIDAAHGYYGSSSGYSDTSAEFGAYLAKAINKHRALLCDTAVEMAREDAEKARKAAEDEARLVLGEVKAAE